MSLPVNGMVSVIIPVYNRPTQLREAVASVLEQDYRPIEIIIVDDGSTDDVTHVTAEELARQFSQEIRLISQLNGGPGTARETGRRVARGEFIQYLDSDDVLLPGKFTSQVAALNAAPDADVAYGVTLFRDHTGTLNPAAHKDTGIRRDAMFPSFLNGRWWETATPLYRRTITDRAGSWTDLRLEEDWEYDCRVASLGARLAYCAVAVSEHRDHTGSRLSRGSCRDPVRMKMRAESHDRVWRHALAAGLHNSARDVVANFGRSLFLLARQCGAAGLPKEAGRLHALAVDAARMSDTATLDLRVAGLLAYLLGWVIVGRFGELADRLRRRR